MALISCNSKNNDKITTEEEKVIIDTFEKLIGDKYYKRDVLKMFPYFIEQAIQTQDYSKLYQIDTVLYPFCISNVINEPSLNDSIIDEYYKTYYEKIEWYRNNEDSLRLIVFLDPLIESPDIKHIKKYDALDTIEQKVLEILSDYELQTLHSTKIDFSNKNFGRFTVSHDIQKYQSKFENQRALEINPMEGYREIGYMKISKVLFNDENTIAIYFVMKLLYHDSCFQMVVSEKTGDVWILKNIITLL